jgi:hypothetical protein
LVHMSWCLSLDPKMDRPKTRPTHERDAYLKSDIIVAKLVTIVKPPIILVFEFNCAILRAPNKPNNWLARDLGQDQTGSHRSLDEILGDENLLADRGLNIANIAST